MINKKPIIIVNFAINPAGPFAPNNDSLLPLYTPKPMLELFCNSTAIVITIDSIICIISKTLVIPTPILTKINLVFYYKIKQFSIITFTIVNITQINYMLNYFFRLIKRENMNSLILSFFIPCIIFIMIILTRRLVISIAISIIFISIIMHYDNPVAIFSFIINKFTAIFYSFDSYSINIDIAFLFLFLILLGILSEILIATGATKAFQEWIKPKTNNTKIIESLIIALGVIIFIDGYFSAMVVGQIARPLSKTYNITKEKIAYFIDSTAAPVAAIVPISSLGAYFIGILNQNMINNKDDIFSIFIHTLIYNFYSWFTLLCAMMVIIFNIPFKTIQHKKNKKETYQIQNKQSLKSLIIPLLSLIIISFIMIICLGYEEKELNNIFDILARTNMTLALLIGSIVSVILAIYLGRKNLKINTISLAFYRGCKEMVLLISILVLAWIVGAIMKEDLKIGMHIVNFMQDSFSSNWLGMLPAILFITSAFIAFSTGTSWGTLAIVVPFCIDIITHISIDTTYTAMILAAALSGSLFGDHSSPISDTTIISASSAGCSLHRHFITQLPFALTTAACSIIGYIIFGLTQDWIAGFIIGALSLYGILHIIKYILYKKIKLDLRT